MRGRDLLLPGLVGIAGAAAASTASETINYSYDARGRLVRVAHNGSANADVVTNYSYDKTDNRILKNMIGAPQ